jgi:Ca2+-transporting ATPase
MGNKMFIVIIFIIVAMQVIMVHFGGAIFRTVPLELITWLKIVGLSATVIPVGYIARYIAKVLTAGKS